MTLLSRLYGVRPALRHRVRARPWFGGEPATWGACDLGLVQWEPAVRDIPEWRIALIQDAP
ncbi:hypothetical protein [Streptosporangium sp. NPDC003464]